MVEAVWACCHACRGAVEVRSGDDPAQQHCGVPREGPMGGPARRELRWLRRCGHAGCSPNLPTLIPAHPLALCRRGPRLNLVQVALANSPNSSTSPQTQRLVPRHRGHA